MACVPPAPTGSRPRAASPEVAMPGIHVTCPGCQATLKLADVLAGERVLCPRCKTVSRVPGPEAQVPEPASEDLPRPDAIKSRLSKDEKVSPRVEVTDSLAKRRRADGPEWHERTQK